MNYFLGKSETSFLVKVVSAFDVLLLQISETFAILKLDLKFSNY